LQFLGDRVSDPFFLIGGFVFKVQNSYFFPEPHIEVGKGRAVRRPRRKRSGLRGLRRCRLRGRRNFRRRRRFVRRRRILRGWRIDSLIVSMLSIFTVLPSAGTSSFVVFFFPNREQDARKKERTVRRMIVRKRLPL